MKIKERIEFLKNEVLNAKPSICTERAVIWTDYYRNSKNRKKPVVLQIAEALKEVLLKKSISIYPNELIVGNFSSKRVGGSIYPELHGLPMLEDLPLFSKRKQNPLQITTDEIGKLLKVIPFWSTRFLALKAYSSPIKTIKFMQEQLSNTFYILNELGGIAHFAPDYEKLLTMGTNGIIKEILDFQKNCDPKSDTYLFYEGAKIILKALADFGLRYGILAEQMADIESDKTRKKELLNIAEVCKNVPAKPASNFHEALQSLFIAQIALNLESLDNGITPGRMDQYLYSYYKADIKKKKLTKNRAKELIASFSIKMSELIPVFSKRLTRIHGGLPSGQVVTVGGLDSEGKDASNELSYIFLEVIDELRLRQPNYHARIHKDAPAKYLNKVFGMLSKGSSSPALYNDELIMESMKKQGYSDKDAFNYTAIGCVEPSSQGKSFASTDAALFNLPVVLELALNEGRLFGHALRKGARTKPASCMNSIKDVKDAFEAQLKFRIDKLVQDLKAVETANKNYHPTPLSSSLIHGCIESGKCSTNGGAKYNYSGVQAVGVTDTGDSLYAIEKAVFIDKKVTMHELVKQLKNSFKDINLFSYLKNLNKFGNDIEHVDNYTLYVINLFSKILERYENTRGGKYIAGIYSMTSHQFFGDITGSLPNGRKTGEPFSSGMAPGNSCDKNGPTALLNSMNRLDFTKTPNGINFNLKFNLLTLGSKTGKKAMESIVKTYFKRGGMQTQINVLSPDDLIKARTNPELYPDLLVRVSGYSAYFNDLTPEIKNELITRSMQKV